MNGAASSTPVSVLREQFGDHKPPDITRKITACVACRKQKIKCHMRDSQPPCTRCKKRGLPCTVNKSLQMILESDSVWKESIERQINNLRDAVGKLSGHLSLPDLLDTDTGDGLDDEPESHEIPVSVNASPLTERQTSHNVERHTPHNFEIVMDPDSGPAAIPGSVVTPIAGPGYEQSKVAHDVITRNIVTIEQAQGYLDIYQNRLDHFLYRILGDRWSLSQVRAASPLLLAAICAVGALHLASRQFDKCYEEFVSIAAAQNFSRKHTEDDVRGLCVGAFWLSGISWACIGAAVRISTEIGLHRSIFKALAGDRKHYLRTRLYYIVWICDHHFSIAYGRPPMTRQDDAIRASSQFLETENAVEDDARLMSQVQFWAVGSDLYESFGVDVERPLDLQMIEPLRRHAIKLDNIRADWTERFSYNQYVGNYPRKGVVLHYHFAKLYLYSLAFRGIGQPGFKAPEVSLDIDELNGLPTYFDVMIAFAVVFLLKVATKYAALVRVDTSEIRSLVAQLVNVLKVVTSSMHQRHLLVSVARGCEKLLESCCLPEMQGPFPANAHVTMSQPTFDQGLYDMSSGWNGLSFDNFFMGEFDLLSNQDIYSNYQPGFQYQSMTQV